MAIRRSIDTQIWYDELFADKMSQEEKLLWFYCLCNTHNNLCGTAIIPLRVMAFETGFNQKELELMLLNFEKYNIAKYNIQNNELLVLKWSKYNWSTSLNVKQSLEKQLKDIKTEEFKNIVIDKINGVQWSDKDNHSK